MKPIPSQFFKLISLLIIITGTTIQDCLARGKNPFKTSQSKGSKRNVITPDQALDKLLKGNKEFIKIWKSTPDKDRLLLAKEQHPFAIVLTCSDSRLSPEILFNQLKMGNLFVVRNAGNIVDDLTINSIEYGIEHLHAPLVIILGHERCGAATATVEALLAHQPGTSEIIKELTLAFNVALQNEDMTQPMSATIKNTIITDTVLANIKLSAVELYEKSQVIKNAVDNGIIKIVGGYYDLDDGNVHIVS